MTDAHLEWAALELDDYGNGPRWPAFRDAVQSHGKAAGVWVTHGANVAGIPRDADFVIAELETEDDYVGVLNATVPDCPRAVLTNFGPIDAGLIGLEDARQKAAPLIAAGYACLTEAYLGDNPQATPDALGFRAEQLGWSESQPVFGVYNAPVERYAEWQRWPGHAYYLGENFL